MKILNYIGTAVLIIIASYIFVEIIGGKYKKKGLIGRLILLAVCVFATLRT